MRKRGRLDANHPEIVNALTDIGAKVLSLANLGNGTPDILVGFRGRLFLMEIKTNAGKLTPDEAEWHDAQAIIDASGQREGMRRMRELRQIGYTVEERRETGRREWQYRLVSPQ